MMMAAPREMRMMPMILMRLSSSPRNFQARMELNTRVMAQKVERVA